MSVSFHSRQLLIGLTSRPQKPVLSTELLRRAA